MKTGMLDLILYLNDYFNQMHGQVTENSRE